MISGAARGHRLRAPSGWWVRPTADRLKESLFDFLDVEWEGNRVLDLFAGSGALGIEALSRGAARAVFVEADRRCIQVILRNLDSCGMAGRYRIVRADVLRFLAGRKGQMEFDVILADPPYGKGLARACLLAVDRRGWLAASGKMVVEHSRREPLPERGGGLTLEECRSYGESVVSVYERAETG